MGYFRDNETYGIKLLKGRHMMEKYFDVLRFITEDFVCYLVQTREQLDYSYEIVAKSESKGMIYAFGFSRAIAMKASFVMPVVHDNFIPYTSLQYAPQSDFSMAENLTVFRLVSQKVEKHLLPYPYITDCNEYKTEGRETLMNKCLVIMTINQFGFIPFSELKAPSMFAKYDHLKIMHPFEFATNRTLWSGMKRIKTYCDRIYRKVECQTFFYTTHIVGRHNWGDGLVFRVGQPTSPTITVVYHPSQDFITFLLFTLSCFGVWLGWSLMDFEPSSLIEQFSSRDRDSMVRIGTQRRAFNGSRPTVSTTHRIVQRH